MIVKGRKDCVLVVVYYFMVGIEEVVKFIKVEYFYLRFKCKVLWVLKWYLKSIRFRLYSRINKYFFKYEIVFV